MKNYIIRTVKMAAYYSFLGLILQGILVNILLAVPPAEGQNLRDVKVKANAVDISLEQAFQMLEQKTSFKFNYIKEEIPLNEKVTVIVEDESLYNILEVFAKDYGLTFNRVNNQITVKKNQGQTENLITDVEGGTVKGKVTDSKTGEPLIGANVMVKGTSRGAATDNKGNYVIENLTSGEYSIVVKYVGYNSKTEVVNVAVNKTVELNFGLEQTTVGMNEVVVTGYMTETEMRKVETPITVVTAVDIERLPVRTVSDIFRGFIPSAALVEFGGVYDYTGQINIRGASTLGGASSKIYVDGVEVSPTFQGLIDQKSIERIEVSRGLGSTTLYGSDASGGVIQIFTKKGIQGSRLTIGIAGGIIESPLVTRTPILQEYYIDYSGGVLGFSYNLGATYTKRDPVFPDNDDKFISVYGSARAGTGPVVVDFTIKYANKEFGITQQPDVINAYRPNIPYYQRAVIPAVTLGANLKYVANTWWVHNLTIGYDQINYNSYGTQPRRTSPADTLTSEYFLSYQTITLRYNSTIFISSEGDFKSKLTFGTEWAGRGRTGANGNKTTTIGNNINLVGGRATRDKWQSGGYFIQLQPELWDKLFITAGVRAEYNDLFGNDYGAAVSPRIGAAFNIKYGNILIKPRVSYGKGIRGVTRIYKEGQITPTYQTIPNQNIAPESQIGGDFGVDLYLFDGSVNLEGTYYDQTANNLIQSVTLDPDPRFKIYQYQNIGEVKNKGYEFAAQYSSGAFDIRGTYSITSSKVQKLSPSYTGELLVGDQVKDIPRSMGNIRISYNFNSLFGFSDGGSVSFELNHHGTWRELDVQSYYAFALGGQPYRGSLRAYYIDYKPVTKLNLTLNYYITQNLEVYLNVWNLTNNTAPELGNFYNSYNTEGRRILIGSRITL